MKRDDLKNGDIILFRATNLVTDLIGIFEQDGTDHFTQYIHAATVLDAETGTGFQMIAPKSQFFDLSTVDWAHADLYRSDYPLDIDAMVVKAHADVGTPYPYDEDAKFMVADILGRQGAGWAEQWVDSWASSEDPRLMVCSATTCYLINAGAHSETLMRWPRPVTNMRPCDIPQGAVTLVVKGIK